MIKKIYAILFALNLMAALPALGMENDIADQEHVTYQCDFCNKSEQLFRVTKAHGWYVKCYHILCERCFDAAFHFIHHKGPFSDKVWWNCAYCSYFCHHQKNIRLQITKDKGSISFLSGGTPFDNKELKDYINELNIPNPTNEIPQNFKLRELIGLTCAAGIICYGAYKAYQWWKGEEVQDNDADDEQAEKDATEPVKQI